MKVDNLSMLLVKSLQTALPKAPSGFKLAEGETVARPVPAPATTPATSVQMLVALAAADPAIERRRKMASDAERGLQSLEKLHTELLAGTPSVERLRELVEWSETVEPPEDPVLAQVFRDIDVRVRVELAKFDIQA